MKLRILAALVLVPLLLMVVFLAPKIVAVLLIGLLCAFSVYELLWSTGILRQPRPVAYTAIVAFLVPLWCYFGADPLWAKIVVLAFFSALFAEVLASHGKLKFERVSACIAAGLLLPFLFSSLVRILDGTQGRAFLLIPFVAKHVGFVECAALPGAAAMDTVLPVVVGATHERITLYSFASGVVLSLLVPVLVPAIVALPF